MRKKSGGRVGRARRNRRRRAIRLSILLSLTGCVVGVCAPNAADSIAKILPASRLRRGVVVTTTEKGVHVELYVVIEYGTNITTVSQNLVDQVSFALTEYARVPLDGVEVHVQGIKVRK